MNITQILQIADWNIAHTGNSHLESGPIAGQNKYVLVNDYMLNDSCYYTVHFNKNTDEVLAIIVHERNVNNITIYAVKSVIEAVILEELQDAKLKNTSRITVLMNHDDIIDKLNKLHGRESDSFLEFENITISDLALIDQASADAGLTRNGFLTKIIIDQCSTATKST